MISYHKIASLFLLLLSPVLLNHKHKKYLSCGLCVDTGIKLQSPGWRESVVMQRPLLTRFGGAWRTGRRVPPRAAGHFPSQSPGEGRESGRASSRPCCLLEPELLSEKLKTCLLPTFLSLSLVYQRTSCHFLESCRPQLMSDKRGSWWTFC